VITRDYAQGLGFQGVAKGALEEHARRSVNAVADTWHTILTNRGAAVYVSPNRIRDYLMNALEFSLKRGNKKEAERVYERVLSRGFATPELRGTIGDMFYASGDHERAIKEYTAVVAENPERKDVAAKISAYYQRLGDEAAAKSDLKTASASYAKAVAADKIDPEAREKLLNTEKKIREQEEGLAKAAKANQQAAAFENESERQAALGNFSQAMETLMKAEQTYAGVPAEFPGEQAKAAVGLRNIATRRRELKDRLVGEAQQLSGSGVSGDIEKMAKPAAEEVALKGLRSILTRQYDAETARLRDDLRKRIPIRTGN
jgi:tetratricopeptide (TPR) repeat protein